MKKTLTIILLSISLSGFSQTEKGDWVITPTVGWNLYRKGEGIDFSQTSSSFPVSIHKYLSDRFAVGIVNEFYYQNYQPNAVSTSFYRSSWQISVEPEIRYNILKTRFTPFVSAKVNFWYWNSQFNDSPAIPVVLRRISNFVTYSPNFQIDVGASYFIKDRLGLQLKVASFYNVPDGIQTQFYLPYNLGLQFIINNPR
jgi:hypothetical protein